MSKKGRVKKIFFMILLFILISILGLGISQYKNVKALYISTQYTKEELAQKIDQEKSNTEKIIKEKYNVDIRDISAEDEDLLMSGKASVKDILKKYNLAGAKGEKSGEDETTAIVQESDASSVDKVTASAVDRGEQIPKSSGVISKSSYKDPHTQDIIGDKIGGLYALKAEYLSKLGRLESRARADYSAASKKDKKAKEQFMYKYIGIAGDMESQCDAEVEAILSDLNRALSAKGEDTSIVGVLRSSYQDEKVLKKSYYMKKFQ